MKKLFNRTLSILCAVMLLISAVSAWAVAEEEAATPTDLNPVEEEIITDPTETEIIPEEPGTEPQANPEAEPVQETQQEPEAEPVPESVQEPAEKPEEDGITSVEVVITKTLTVGQSWEGKMKKTKPAILKLDVTTPGTIYMLVEGKDVWATVEKSDRQTENPTRTQTDPETDRLLYSWEAEEGSYLITLGPVEPNLLAKATVSFMNQNACDAWEAEQAERASEPEAEPEDELEKKPEEETETSEEKTEEENEPAEEETKPEEPDEEPGNEPEDEQPEEKEEDFDNSKEEEKIPDQSEDRFVKTSLKWDVAFPIIGDTAHLSAELIGYEDLEYTLQWQNSLDKEQWSDVPEATDLTLDVLMTEENNYYYWRLVVYLEDDQEA